MYGTSTNTSTTHFGKLLFLRDACIHAPDLHLLVMLMRLPPVCAQFVNQSAGSPKV